MTDKDDVLRCPHCDEETVAPSPSAKTTMHERACFSCKKRFVIQDQVEHRMQTAMIAPITKGDLFRIADTMFNGKMVYKVKTVTLSAYQGWWVTGTDPYGKDGVMMCSVAAKDIEPLTCGETQAFWRK